VTPEQTIRDAATVDQFLKNEVIDATLKGLAVRYYAEFRASDSSEKRVTSWAKTNVLEDFLTELRAVVSAGEAAVLNAARAEALRTRKEI
jgi:hypothetical protein